MLSFVVLTAVTRDVFLLAEVNVVKISIIIILQLYSIM